SPRAVFELIRLLLESEVIVRSGSMSWKIDDMKLARTELPANYDELITRRREGTEEAERDLLAKAAVVGEVFWLDAVVSLVRVSAMKSEDPDGPTLTEIAAAGDHTRVSVARALSKLVEREWIIEVNESSVPGEREYRFAYPNLWNIVYNAIDDQLRRGLDLLISIDRYDPKAFNLIYTTGFRLNEYVKIYDYFTVQFDYYKDRIDNRVQLGRLRDITAFMNTGKLLIQWAKKMKNTQEEKNLRSLLKQYQPIFDNLVRQRKGARFW
ncbi:MAG: hypothetical protein IID32_06075, partial [Planctomycetes bacterium]|nr:hypothetical protein [Planctomycetota bacterium]